MAGLDLSVLTPYISLTLSLHQTILLAVLLGAFLGVTISDIRYMSAQTEVSVWAWLIILAIPVLIDGSALYRNQSGWPPLAVKWTLITVLAALCHEDVGVIFKLATGDVVAIITATAVLTPIFVIIYFILLKVFDLLLRPLLRMVGSGGSYPFMPVVFSATLVVAVAAMWMNRIIVFW